MAAKNYARFLPMAINSVIAQTIPDWELLIVDDGSTDSTPETVRPYLSDPRIRYFRSDRLGQSRAKNLGTRLSRSDIIAFLDADDAWVPTKLEKQLSLLAARPEVGVCFCRRKLMDEAGRVRPAQDPSPPRGRVLDTLFVRNFICFSSSVVRRSVFDHVGGFDPCWDLAIDYDLWLRAARHTEFDYVDEELVYYRTGHANLSQRIADRVQTVLSIMTRHTENYGLAAELPRAVIGEGFASTCRTLGYELRQSAPLTAASWYWRALQYPGRRWLAVRGLIKCAWIGLSRPRLAHLVTKTAKYPL
jgi:glycosyltransferase involved in cell wall biosynthesis